MGNKGDNEEINYSEIIDGYVFNISTEIEDIAATL